MPSFATSELDKIQNQIKQTEQQNKQITIQLETSNKDVEQTKKKLVKAANQFSTLEEQRNALAQRIAELDAQRDKISAQLSQSYDGLADSTAGMLFIASNPDFDSENMHDYILTSILLSSAADQFDSQIMDATNKIEQLDKIREQRAIEKE